MIFVANSWLPTPPDNVEAWVYYSLVIAAVIVMGIAKSGFGGGVGILAVPLIANAFPEDQTGKALGVMLPILIVADSFAVYQHRRHQSWPHMRPALLGAVVGIGLGTLLLYLLIRNGGDAAKENVSSVLSVIVGSICLLMVAVQVYRLGGGRVPPLSGSKPTAIGVGASAGFTSMLAHAAGPIMSIYWLDQKMGKRVLTGSLVLFFIIVNTAKLPSYILLLDWITLETLKESAAFAVFVPIGSLLGIVMHHRIPEKPFTAVMYAGAAVAGAWLIMKVAI